MISFTLDEFYWCVSVYFFLALECTKMQEDVSYRMYVKNTSQRGRILEPIRADAIFITRIINELIPFGHGTCTYRIFLRYRIVSLSGQNILWCFQLALQLEREVFQGEGLKSTSEQKVVLLSKNFTLFLLFFFQKKFSVISRAPTRIAHRAFPSVNQKPSSNDSALTNDLRINFQESSTEKIFENFYPLQNF